MPPAMSPDALTVILPPDEGGGTVVLVLKTSLPAQSRDSWPVRVVLPVRSYWPALGSSRLPRTSTYWTYRLRSPPLSPPSFSYRISTFFGSAPLARVKTKSCHCPSLWDALTETLWPIFWPSTHRLKTAAPL